MSGKIVLVTGGARSGKSTFAEKYVAALGSQVAYIATAEALDDEMTARVALHRARRPASWRTFEAPRAAAAVLAQTGAGAVLFDCLTVYVTNLLLDPAAPAAAPERHRHIQSEIAALVAAARASAIWRMLHDNYRAVPAFSDPTAGTYYELRRRQ